MARSRRPKFFSEYQTLTSSSLSCLSRPARRAKTKYQSGPTLESRATMRELRANWVLRSLGLAGTAALAPAAAAIAIADG